jgi:hypothetical protein
MTTAYDWRLIQRLDSDAARIGMEVRQSKHGNDLLALVPKDNSLPIYTREAELAAGTAEHLQSVVQGWNKAYEYFSALKIISQQKLLDAENKVMQERLAHVLTTGTPMSRIDK